jgi:transglutaminase-like putative cysteine protease
VSFALLHKLVTYLMSGLGLYALSLGGELGTTPTALFALGWAVSAFVEGDRLRDPRWIRGWNIVVVGFFFVEVVRGVLGEPFLAMGLEYAGFLQISRLFNRRGGRDHQQIAILAFLHLIAATVLSTDLAYGFVFVGFVIVTPWMLVLTHLRQEIEGNYEAPRGPTERRGPDVQRVLASRRIVGPRFLVGTLALTIPIFAITVALFLVFPRVGLGFLSFGSGGGQRTAGFGRNIELGDFGLIRDNPTVIMRLKLPAGSPPRPRLELHMRGTSFDRYDGRRWTRSDAAPERVRNEDDDYLIRRRPRVDDERMEVILDHLDEQVIFLPPGVVAIAIPPRIEGAVDRARQVQTSMGFDFRYLDNDGLGLRYAAYVSGDPGEIFAEELEPLERQRYLALPSGVERVAALARELTEGVDDDLVRASRIEAHLRDSGTYAYSLEMPRVEDDERPLDVFLFDARSGHCEYYSTAMAVMLRSLGVPTRNVTGFVGATYNPYGEYYSVHQGDAHSWVEAHVRGQWVTFDPTPAARGEIRASDDVFAEVRAMFDALRTRWSRDVVGYDLRTQVEALRKIFRWTWQVRQKLSSLSGDRDEGEDDAGPSSDGVAPLVGAVIGLLAIGLLVFFAIRRRRGPKKGGRRATEEAQAAIRLYRDLERALRRGGLPRPPSRTPREHADAIRATGHPFSEVVEEVTVRYEASRWGGERLPDEEVARLRKKIAEIPRGARA